MEAFLDPAAVAYRIEKPPLKNEGTMGEASYDTKLIRLRALLLFKKNARISWYSTRWHYVGLKNNQHDSCAKFQVHGTTATLGIWDCSMVILEALTARIIQVQVSEAQLL